MCHNGTGICICPSLLLMAVLRFCAVRVICYQHTLWEERLNFSETLVTHLSSRTSNSVFGSLNSMWIQDVNFDGNWITWKLYDLHYWLSL